MAGESDLNVLLKSMKPLLHDGEYIFCTVSTISNIHLENIICLFKEKEGVTIVIDKSFAGQYHLSYSSVFAWITLSIYSSLEAVGLTAAFSDALGKAGISCNVIAAYYHDHIFVDVKDALKAMKVLEGMSK